VTSEVETSGGAEGKRGGRKNLSGDGSALDDFGGGGYWHPKMEVPERGRRGVPRKEEKNDEIPNSRGGGGCLSKEEGQGRSVGKYGRSGVP